MYVRPKLTCVSFFYVFFFNLSLRYVGEPVSVSSSSSSEADQTIEILMSDLDPAVMNIFHRHSSLPISSLSSLPSLLFHWCKRMVVMTENLFEMFNHDTIIREHSRDGREATKVKFQ